MGLPASPFCCAAVRFVLWLWRFARPPRPGVGSSVAVARGANRGIPTTVMSGCTGAAIRWSPSEQARGSSGHLPWL